MKRFIFLLTAIFICTIAYAHTINWHVGNTILETTTCDSGESITPPAAPYKYGYHFVKWDSYTPIEYLEGNTNVQYINTGVIPTSSMNVSAKVQLMSDTEITSTFFFGGRTQSASGTGVTGMWSPSGLIFDWFGSGSADRYTVSATRTVGDTLEYTINNSLVTIKRNGTVAGTHQFAPTGTSTQSLYINGINNGGVPVSNNTAKARVYKFTITNNGTLIRDFIPVLDGNGTPCMYDRVEGKFYYNAGTGDFIAGPVIGE